jgi:hypothetical protein
MRKLMYSDAHSYSLNKLEASDQLNSSADLPSEKAPLVLFGWFVPRAPLDVEVQRKILSYPGNRTLVVHCIASHYTN